MIRLLAIILSGLFFLQGCAPLAQTVANMAAVYLNQGLHYYDAGRYQLALAEYQQAIELTTTPVLVAYALNLRAATYLQMGDYTRALEEANTSITLEPRLATSFIGRGYVHLKLEQWPAAIADFDHAIALDDKIYQAYMGRAVANVNLARFALAVTDYKAALSLAPNPADSEQLTHIIETLEKVAREQLQPAATVPPTQSRLCIWFNESQRLRSARIASATKFIAYYQQYGAESFAFVEPTDRSGLLAALEEYLPYQRKFITAWQQLGSVPNAEDAWNDELVAEQQKLAATEKMINGIKNEDNNRLTTGGGEFHQAMYLSEGAVAAMREIREQCIKESR